MHFFLLISCVHAQVSEKKIKLIANNIIQLLH